MKRVIRPLAVLALAALVCSVYLVAARSAGPKPAQQQANPGPQTGPQANQPAPPAAAPAKVAAPVPFKSKDSKIKGWKIVIPGGRPLATPAVVDGKVFVGGGFGSHEFYAFDAATGKKVWQYQTQDDGPTAAVVADGHIAFNTESCEIEILTLGGKPVWKKWLGDPLMSMPAIAGGKVYMAYPDSKGDHKYHLACFGLKTGKEQWKKPIAGEIITAPVVDDGQVYLATLDGTLYCFKETSGALVWQEKKNATSSPVVWNKQCYFSRRDETTVAHKGKKVKQQTEQVASRGLKHSGKTKDLVATARRADYLDYSKRTHSAKEAANQKDDASVGFAGVASGGKGSFQTAPAMSNIAQSSVSGVWSYQGSKPFVYKDRLYSAMGDTLQCVDPKTEKVLWKKAIEDAKNKKKAELLDSVVTPPALVNDKLFLGTTYGEVICISAKTGKKLWTANVGEPIVFQPAVASGRVYVSTNSGSLYCLETGDSRDTGWSMWGANAGHNGLAK
ncbi:MAG TPA: PQQ-binding-like beta-propeller repeat protein [Gemmataceae bacterium]|jgi:Ca-activated chloride channel family protein|nr:PQQ-binding-like beta-propeller repeat protein [Gemmataceae bacterium]